MIGAVVIFVAGSALMVYWRWRPFHPGRLWCWLNGQRLTLRYGAPIDGHDYAEYGDGSLLCRVCSKVSPP